MAALPLSVYVIVQAPIMPLQAQLFNAISLLSWDPCTYHDATRFRPSCAVVFGTTLVVWDTLGDLLFWCVYPFLCCTK